MQTFFRNALAALALLLPAISEAQDMYKVPLTTIDGKPATLKAYEGKVLLIVNVASLCGNTPQYKGLDELWRQYKEQGLVVLGFPCNDFGGQEPGDNGEIKTFCTKTYGVSFPLFDKLHVKGPKQHPLYALLTGGTSPFPGDVQWNFGKFLVGRDGKIRARFEPDVEPDSPEVTAAIKAALGHE